MQEVQMAVKPHCVVCGFYAGSNVAGTVWFADYRPAPVGDHPPGPGMTDHGVADFCRRHLKGAQALRHLPIADAVARLQSGGDRGLRSWVRGVIRRSG
jgi:hypothetical protein